MTVRWRKNCGSTTSPPCSSKSASSAPRSGTSCNGVVTGSGTFTRLFAAVAAIARAEGVAGPAIRPHSVADGLRVALGTSWRCSMPRPLRFLPAGSVHHVVNRGNDKKTLFDRTRDFEEFLWLTAWAKQRAIIRIVAYVLMRNHWHFVLWPAAEGQTEKFQHLLTTTHAVRRRRITCTVGQGHIYQDRYRAF